MIGFDLNTLFLVTIYIEALLGLLLLFVWVQNSAITAVAWWGNAHLLRAGSVAIFGLYGSVPDVISIDIANTVLFLAFAATWTGTRVLGHRKPQLLGIIAGPAIWLVLSRVPVIAESMDLRALISSGIITAYTWLAAYELWRDRAEPLLSRWPAIFMLFAHGALFVLRTPLSTMREWSHDLNAFGNVWMTILSHEELLFTVAVAFIMLAMAKERGEMRHKTAAMVDPLTSIANRRAFLEGGDMVAALAAERSCPVAVLLIDLDQFKSINDRYGHFAGDRVLQIFAETASRLITPADVLGASAARNSPQFSTTPTSREPRR